MGMQLVSKSKVNFLPLVTPYYPHNSNILWVTVHFERFGINPCQGVHMSIYIKLGILDMLCCKRKVDG